MFDVCHGSISALLWEILIPRLGLFLTSVQEGPALANTVFLLCPRPPQLSSSLKRHTSVDSSFIVPVVLALLVPRVSLD